MAKMRNQMTMRLKLTRSDVCDLLLACTAAKSCANDGGKKWDGLHEKLEAQLDAFDAEKDEKEAK